MDVELYDILTHWGRVTHICVAKTTIIGSDNVLSPDRRQAIIWTKAGILLIGGLRTNFSEILIQYCRYSFKKMQLKMSSGKWQPSCLGLKVLKSKQCCRDIHRIFPISRLRDCARFYRSMGFVSVGKKTGPVSIWRPSFPGMGIPMLKIRRSVRPSYL